MDDPLSRLAYTAAALARKGAGHHQSPHGPPHQQHEPQHPQHQHRHSHQQLQQLTNQALQPTSQPAGMCSEDAPSDREDAFMADADRYSDDEPSTQNDGGPGGGAGRPSALGSVHRPRPTPPARDDSGGGRDPAPPSPGGAVTLPVRGGGSRGNGSAGGGASGERGRPRDSGDCGRASSPGAEAGEEGSQGGAVGTTSGGGAKRPGNRRPVQFWGIFNDWWRSELERTGKRPSAEAVGTWHAAHAVSCWGPHAPSLEETRTHAKCLRSVGSIREYFRGYRARKRARQSEDPAAAGSMGFSPVLGVNPGIISGGGAIAVTPCSAFAGAAAAAGPTGTSGPGGLPNLAALSSFLPQLSQLGALGIPPLSMGPKFGPAASPAAIAPIFGFPDVQQLCGVSPARTLGPQLSCGPPFGVLPADAAAVGAAGMLPLLPLPPPPPQQPSGCAADPLTLLPPPDPLVVEPDASAAPGLPLVTTITTGSATLGRTATPEPSKRADGRPAAITTAAVSLGGTAGSGGSGAAAAVAADNSSSEGGGVTGPHGGAVNLDARAPGRSDVRVADAMGGGTAPAADAPGVAVAAAAVPVPRPPAALREEDSAFSFRVAQGGSGSDGSRSSGSTPPLLHFALSGPASRLDSLQPHHLLAAMPYADAAAIVHITPRTATAGAAAAAPGFDATPPSAMQAAAMALSTPPSQGKLQSRPSETELLLTASPIHASEGQSDGATPFRAACKGNGGAAHSTGDAPPPPPAAPPSPFAFHRLSSSQGSMLRGDAGPQSSEEAAGGGGGGSDAAVATGAAASARPPAPTLRSSGSRGDDISEQHPVTQNRLQGQGGARVDDEEELATVPSFSLMPLASLPGKSSGMVTTGDVSQGAKTAAPPSGPRVPYPAASQLIAAAAAAAAAAAGGVGRAADASSARAASSSHALELARCPQQQLQQLLGQISARQRPPPPTHIPNLRGGALAAEGHAEHHYPQMVGRQTTASLPSAQPQHHHHQQEQQQYQPAASGSQGGPAQAASRPPPKGQQHSPAQLPLSGPYNHHDNLHGHQIHHDQHQHGHQQQPHSTLYNHHNHHNHQPLLLPVSAAAAAFVTGGGSASHSQAQGASNGHGHSDAQQSAVVNAATAAVSAEAAAALNTPCGGSVPSLRSLLARPDGEICGTVHELRHDQLVLLLMRAIAMVRQKKAHEERLMDELAQVLEQQGNLQAQLHTQRMETARMYRALMAMRDARSSGGGGPVGTPGAGATLASAAAAAMGCGVGAGAAGAGFTSSAVSPPRRRLSMDDEAGLSPAPAAVDGTGVSRVRAAAAGGGNGGGASSVADLDFEPAAGSLPRPTGGAQMGPVNTDQVNAMMAAVVAAAAAAGRDGGRAIWSQSHALRVQHSPARASTTDVAVVAVTASAAAAARRERPEAPGMLMGGRGSAVSPNIAAVSTIDARSTDPTSRGLLVGGGHDASGAFASGGGSVDGAAAKAAVCSDGGSGTSSAF